MTAPEESALFWEYRTGDRAAFLTMGRPHMSSSISFGARRLDGLNEMRSDDSSPPFLSFCKNNAVERAKTPRVNYIWGRRSQRRGETGPVSANTSEAGV